jgi:hypothetical protein
LQQLRARLEAEQLQAVELLASSEIHLSDPADPDFRRLADLHTVICAVRDVISRHSPRLGYGTDPVATDPLFAPSPN